MSLIVHEYAFFPLYIKLMVLFYMANVCVCVCVLARAIIVDIFTLRNIIVKI